MKKSYSEDIMLCFVQGFEGNENGYVKNRGLIRKDSRESNNNNRQPRKKKVSLHVSTNLEIPEAVEEVSKNSEAYTTGKSLQLSPSDKNIRSFPEVKRSFSDRFSEIADVGARKPARGFLTIRKTWSTGNFSTGAAGGGCGAPRSAPATPLQLEPHPRKHDKHVVKPLSGSEPSVPVTALGSGSDTAEGKQPSKARQKKFYRHFPQVGPEERVLNYYSCALVGDLLLQGHLYITKNYFAFYSNVFGYVTKLLIPITSVLRITKEKVARIIPNAVGVCTRDERHVFGSLLSRDTTYKLMMHVWKAARMPEALPNKPTEGRASEVELDASEYSPEDDSSCSGGGDRDTPANRRDSEAIIAAAGGAAIIQPALLTGGARRVGAGPARGTSWTHRALLLAAVLLAATALSFTYSLCTTTTYQDPEKLSTSELYSEIVRWRANLHTKAASELHTFLTTNLLLLTKVRQSLEALSGVILTDLDQNASGSVQLDLPNETFS